MMMIPGESYKGALPHLTGHESASAVRLKTDVTMLATTICERNTEHPDGLRASADYIEYQFSILGYVVQREKYFADNVEVENIIAERKGTAKSNEIIIVGAHYDSAPGGTPGADDNASGVAGVLEIARAFSNTESKRTIRFVAFVNEEPPYFQTELMGSRVHARGCRKRNEKVIAMICLECLGFYSDKPKSQIYPPPLDKYYPNTASFIAFCSNVGSYLLLRKCIKHFRNTTKFPSEGLVAPEKIPVIGWSDHWSFWQEGYPAIMITDTALYRNSSYHLVTDKPELLDFDKMARVVGGISRVVERIQR